MNKCEMRNRQHAHDSSHSNGAERLHKRVKIFREVYVFVPDFLFLNNLQVVRNN